MLTRLLVLTAVIAAFFVFVPTSSAQTTPTLPTECLNITDPDAVTQECLDALAGLTGGGGGGTLPQECQGILGVIGGDNGGGGTSLLDQLTATQLLQLVGCLTALTGGGDDEEEEDEVGEGDLEETGDVGVAGYGGDLGYGEDVGDFPENGVDSGFGPTGSDEPGAPLAARGAALLVLLGVLATGLVVMRRRRSGS